MSKIVLQMPDGNTIEVPQWALESTQEELVTQMKLLVKNAGGDKEAQKKAEKGTKDIVDVLKKGNKDQEKQAEDCLLYTSPSPRDQRG